jgi:hypothetical protein
VIAVEMLVNYGNVLRAFVRKFSVGNKFIISCCCQKLSPVIVGIYDMALEDNQTEIRDLNHN